LVATKPTEAFWIDSVEFRARCVLAEIVNALSDAVDPVLAAIEGVL
jgi:hypothetical protein